jgi:pimeloyl-ACP methyl ester carboxylesterase
MMRPSYWQTAHGGSGDLVLGISFDTGRGESLLTDLAKSMGDRRFLEALPPRPASVDLAKGLDGYLAPWLEDLQHRGDRVSAIIGHCAGASLAAALAARLREVGGSEAALILLDPAEVDARTIATEYHLALRTLAAYLSADELVRAQRAADSGSASADLLPMSQRMDSAYRVAMAAVCGRLPISAEHQDQLCTRLSSYLMYLTASRWAADRATSSTVRPAAIALSAADDMESTPSGAPAQNDATVTIRFGTDRAHLLSDPALADLISKTLSR